uniref:Uncharacterized protein n=1 Tax=Mandrillus leucophaeus TaxID=9568 RepID=A0A2K5XG94_MANLE
MVHCQPYSFFIYGNHHLLPLDIFSQVRDAIVHRFSITVVDLISPRRVHTDCKCLHGIITFYWSHRNQYICYWFSSNCLSNWSPPLYVVNCLYSFPLAFSEFLRTW